MDSGPLDDIAIEAELGGMDLFTALVRSWWRTLPLYLLLGAAAGVVLFLGVKGVIPSWATLPLVMPLIGAAVVVHIWRWILVFRWTDD